MLYSEIIAVCSQIHIITLCGQNVEFVNVFSSYRAVNTLHLGYKTSQLVLYSEIMAVFLRSIQNTQMQSVGQNL
jgi:hypothetical protein